MIETFKEHMNMRDIRGFAFVAYVSRGSEDSTTILDNSCNRLIISSLGTIVDESVKQWFQTSSP